MAKKKSAPKKAPKKKAAAGRRSTSAKKSATTKKVARVIKPVPSKVRAKATVAKARITEKNDEARKLAESAVHGILEKKGQNVRWLDLRNIENAVCDYFIICEGNSRTQVEAIADSVEMIVKKETGQRPYRSEGWENALWILIDYINVVVHVFEPDTRHFYNLESLWADAEEIPVKQ